jgi:uncharacterized membrane protein HdeD (DUF308 family)
MDITSTHAAQPAPAHLEVPEVDAEAAGRAWYLFAVSGVVSGAIGVLVLAYPGPSLKLLGVFLGIDLIAGGVLSIVHGTSSRESGSALVMLGTLAVIAGLLVIRNPGHSIALLALAFAIYLIVAGSLALGGGIVHRNGRARALVRGAVLVTAGTVIISWPEPSLKTLTVLIGIALLLQGVVEIAEGFALRALGGSRDADPLASQG